MNDAEDVTSKLVELLRHPDDLDKITSLKAEFSRKKAAVDSQLKLGLKEQLEITQAGMTSITEGQRTVNLIKEEMMKIDKLCAEAQNMIRDFPFVDKIAQTHRNFQQVEEMKTQIDGFGARLDELEQLLREDDQDMENQNNLLAVHYGLSQLRDVRDQAMEQIKSSEDASLELINNLQLESGATLQDYFARLDEVVDWFDDHVGQACMNLIPLVQSGNNGMVVRLALIVEEEEKKDKQVKALQDAQREYKDLASRLKSMNLGPKELRGYKEKFLKAIEFSAQSQFEQSKEAFVEDPDKLEKSVRWYFNDLNTVKLGMVSLMPKKWHIFKTYVNIYHKLMHDFLIDRVQDPELNPPHMLAILHWVSKYYAKMNKLGVPEDQLHPHVIDDREADIVREYRQLITTAVEQWMERMSVTDRQTFLERKEGSLDTDENGCFRTKTLGDMWRMLREQLNVATSSDRPDVVEGVIEAMFRALEARQRMWERLVDSEQSKYMNPNLTPQEQEGLQPLQDWLVAIANDQIACIDDHEEEGITSYLTRFKRDYEPLVTPAYAVASGEELDRLRDGYVDLGTHCIGLFGGLIFTVDFRSIMSEFFTAAWYGKKAMAQIISTFEDYLADYSPVLHPSLRDILIEELADELLVRYLSAIRNKNVKFRRSDPFTDKIKDDVVTVFGFFSQFDASFPDIKNKWRVVNSFVELLNADKGQVADVYEAIKREYWDVQMGWVEAVLRSREDFERSMAASVKARAAEVYVERGPETVMTKIR
ncbi:SNARE-binding exocyst subunit S6 [Zalaria obscura]|uniref:SNARE-binding exocyst subunit S6 n=1 Tax=Zalaria obscura TaxID=2024903 RepID=A0ACC3S725_9PEZI